MPRLLLLSAFILAGCATSNTAADLPAAPLRHLMEPCDGEQCGVAVVLVESAETGEPISEANVASVVLSRGAATSEEGIAIVPRLPVGPVTFRVDFIGFEGTEVTLEIPAGGIVVQRARLEPMTESFVY